MKLFAIIQSRNEVHIRRTDNNISIPTNVICGQADTYEEAVIIRDKVKASVEERRSIAADKWHDEWRKAEEKNDMNRLNHLAGIR